MIGLIILVVVAAVAIVGWMNLRRHGEASVAGNWTRTDEVFRDPSSNRVMRVWLDPSDGTRHYVPE